MQTDILIIGGGVAGLSAAAALAPGASVIVAEAETAVGYHASGRSAALYEPHYGNPVVVALSLASGDFYRGTEGLLSPRGLLLVGGDEAAAEAAAMAMTPITVDQARALVPILNPAAMTFAAHADHAWDIDTGRLLDLYQRDLRAAGGQVLTRCPVTALTRAGGIWRATTPLGEIAARVVVNAAGAWADRVAAMAGVAPLGLTPYRRSMARIPAPGGHDVSRWPMIFGAGEAWYAKPDAGALIVSPAEEHLVEPHDAWADDMVLAEGLARYEEMVTEPVTRVIANWAGLRTFSPDRAPVIGFAPGVEGFFWLAGQGGYGFQTAPAAAALAADLIAGRDPATDPGLVSRLSPLRFA